MSASTTTTSRAPLSAPVAVTIVYPASVRAAVRNAPATFAGTLATMFGGITPAFRLSDAGTRLAVTVAATPSDNPGNVARRVRAITRHALSLAGSDNAAAYRLSRLPLDIRYTRPGYPAPTRRDMSPDTVYRPTVAERAGL